LIVNLEIRKRQGRSKTQLGASLIIPEQDLQSLAECKAGSFA
jgi:hypothetical protein